MAQDEYNNTTGLPTGDEQEASELYVEYIGLGNETDSVYHVEVQLYE